MSTSCGPRTDAVHAGIHIEVDRRPLPQPAGGSHEQFNTFGGVDRAADLSGIMKDLIKIREEQAQGNG